MADERRWRRSERRRTARRVEQVTYGHDPSMIRARISSSHEDGRPILTDMEDVFMQIKDLRRGVGEEEPQVLERVLELHKSLADAAPQEGDRGDALYGAPLLEEGTQRLIEIRARVLSGAYHSLEMADQVARAILRSGIVTFPPYE